MLDVRERERKREIQTDFSRKSHINIETIEAFTQHCLTSDNKRYP